MGRTYGAICNECDTSFHVNEGPGMLSMPLRCNRCGREWWWEFGSEGPSGKKPERPRCECGGRFTQSAPPRCPSCASKDLRRDPDGYEILYD